VPPEAPYPGGSSGRVNGTRGQLTKMTRGFTPCGSSMAATAPVVACWPEFSLDRYTYDGGWDIYAAGPPSGLAASARVTARGQSRLRHGKVIFATSTLRRWKTRSDLFTGTSITAQSRRRSSP
jgi:hypothetical protein